MQHQVMIDNRYGSNSKEHFSAMKLGIVNIDSDFSNTIIRHPNENDYSMAVISEKKEMDEIDGLIIPMTSRIQLTAVIDWLIACQTQRKIFIWVFSKESLENEEIILRQLGANEIITKEENLLSLFLSIKNMEAWLDQKQVSTGAQLEGLLNSQNQTVVVNGAVRSLTRKEYLLLKTLYENEGNVVSYTELMTLAWPNNPEEHMYRLMNTMFHLRKKVNDSNDFNISNVRSRGYVLRKKG